MRRALNVGGRQGRDPMTAPAPDALAVAIATHLIETTADAAIGPAMPRLNHKSPYSGNVLAWWLIREQHMRRLLA